MTAAAPKMRIPWDGDAASPDGQTSIAILLEWLSAPGNCDRWRFGGVQHSDGRGGRSALGPHFSKIELAREVLQCMEAHGITHRLARDVRWKINALLRSYATAAHFLDKYEQQKRDVLRQAVDTREAQRAIESSEPRVMTHVYTLCPYFDALNPVLKGDISDLQPTVTAKIKREAGVARRGVSAHDDMDDMDDDSGDCDRGGDAAELSDGDDHGSPRGFFESERTRLRASSALSSSRARKRSDLDDTDADDDGDDDGSAEASQLRSARRRRQADAQFTTRRRALVLENLGFDNQIKRLQLEREQLLLAKERALSRRQLQDAGVAPHEIELVVASHSFLQPQC